MPGRVRTIPCKVPDCGKDAAANNSMCPMHRRRVRLYGDPDVTVRKPQGHRDAPPDSSDPPLAQVLRVALERQRSLGNSWTWAWSVARAHGMRAAGPRSDWFAVFVQTEPQWRDAYLRRPADRKQAAFSLLAILDDRGSSERQAGLVA